MFGVGHYESSFRKVASLFYQFHVCVCVWGGGKLHCKGLVMLHRRLRVMGFSTPEPKLTPSSIVDSADQLQATNTQSRKKVRLCWNNIKPCPTLYAN